MFYQKWKAESVCFAFHNRNKHLYLLALGDQLNDKKSLLENRIIGKIGSGATY